MKNIKIGGVPEHFNLPWYLTLRDKSYHEKDINLRWHDYFGGTGQMCKALRNKEIDMAVILTEGIIRDIIDGNECKIVQTLLNVNSNPHFNGCCHNFQPANQKYYLVKVVNIFN